MDVVNGGSLRNLQDKFGCLLKLPKEPAQNWNVNIPDLLDSFLKEGCHLPRNPGLDNSLFHNGDETINFNAAALLVQGMSNLYGKRIDNLYTLAYQLLNILRTIKKQPTTTSETTKSHDQPRKKSASLFSHLPQLKVCKNIYLSEEDELKLSNIREAKALHPMPIQLMPLQDFEKGNAVIKSEDNISNRKDFFLNVCTPWKNGLLLLPSIDFSEDVKEESYVISKPDPNSKDFYEVDLSIFPEFKKKYDDFKRNDTAAAIQLLPDTNSAEEIPYTAPETDYEYSPPPSQSPCVSDNEDGSPEKGENQAAEQLNGEKNNADKLAEIGENIPDSQASTVPLPSQGSSEPLSLDIEETPPLESIPTRKSARQVAKAEQLKAKQMAEKIASETSKVFYTETDIEKMMDSEIEEQIQPKKQTKKLRKRKKRQKKDNPKKRKTETDSPSKKGKSKSDEQNEKEMEGSELRAAADDDDGDGCDTGLHNDSGFPEDCDVMSGSNGSQGEQCKERRLDPILEESTTDQDTDAIINQNIERYMKDVHCYIAMDEILENVQKWERRVKPLLHKEGKRETFDVHTYGTRILDSFSDSDRKQTQCFREFCHKMPKWQRHRYFSALLHLVNNGNIKITREARPNGTHSIYFSLLSRKQHHEELVSFGHNAGSHG